MERPKTRNGDAQGRGAPPSVPVGGSSGRRRRTRYRLGRPARTREEEGPAGLCNECRFGRRGIRILCDRRGQGGGGPRRSDARRSREEEGTARIRISRATGQGGGSPVALIRVRSKGGGEAPVVCDRLGQGGGGPCRSDLRARPREEEGAARIREFLRATGQGGGSPAALWSACALREEEKRPWCATGRVREEEDPAGLIYVHAPGRRRGRPVTLSFFKATASGRRKMPSPRCGPPREEEGRDRGSRPVQGGGGTGRELGNFYLASAASIATRLIIERLRPRSARSRSLSACSSL
ncbi:hypothetical protein CLV79_10352 [Limimaricola soesokkakensis]|uniref:Uncharacterized protein n=1 Tax=Limimaricola soesokkakensis TaxID=1343159 RepID=A0A1X6YDM9_9RHOB|nr:hypothetical protein CLV79_10352 [Limimaricola soesokkakensis]SLN17887.1 hypothetical protein LOS8367_00348 [Limimaricola soesokkakensis]